VLYGGSVTSANIGEFLAEHSIDGGLVGGASSSRTRWPAWSPEPR